MNLREVFSQIFEKFPMGVLVIDEFEQIIWYNQNLIQLIGLSTPKAVLHQFFQLLKDKSSAKLSSLSFEGHPYHCLRIPSNYAGSKQWVFLVQDGSSEHAQKQRLLIMETMLNSVQEALYAIDKQGNELIYNNKIKRFEPHHKKQMLNELKSVFKTGNPTGETYRKYLSRDHKEIHMLSNCIPVKDNDTILAVFSVNKWVTEVHQLFAKAVDLQNQLNNCGNNYHLPRNGTRYTFADIKGNSYLIKDVISKAKKAAIGNASILLYGETGTGKELFAQSIHNSSAQSESPFVAINCAAIPETLLESLLFGTVKGAFTGAENTNGLLEQAGTGTLFLDEINSMGPNLQAKLLRTLQEKHFRRLGDNKETPFFCRIISSTNEPPQRLTQAGKLRHDFYYRIAGVILEIPPLRKRSEDSIALTNFFLKQLDGIYGKRILSISSELKDLFLNHKWPGNVRELYHILEGAVNFTEMNSTLTPQHLPDYFRPQLIAEEIVDTSNLNVEISLAETLRDVEKNIILKTLTENQGNITASAEKLGIHRQNLQARMKKLNISKMVTFE